MEVVAVNSGNFNTKVKSKKGELIFLTRVQENIDASKYVLFDGARYEIGAGEIDIDNFKQESLTHILCTLYAISVMSSSEDIFLVTCLPVNQFKNKAIRDRYKNSLLGEHTITTNKGTSTFNVKDVIVYMEGAATVLAYEKVFEGQIINVVDIGGYNVNVAQFDNGHLVMGTEDDFDLGVYKMKADITHDLNKTFNMHIKEHELNHILKHHTDEQKPIIDKHFNAFVRQLRSTLKKKGYNLNLNPFMFSGGGSQDIEKYLIASFEKAYVGTVYDAVRGLYEIGVRKCSSV